MWDLATLSIAVAKGAKFTSTLRQLARAFLDFLFLVAIFCSCGADLGKMVDTGTGILACATAEPHH